MVSGVLMMLAVVWGADAPNPALLPPVRPVYPDYLPVFGLSIRIDPQERQVTVTEDLTWTHPGGPPVDKVVVQAHAAFMLPASEEGAMAKTLEMLRLDPRDSLGVKRPALAFQSVSVLKDGQWDEQPVRLGGATGTDLTLSLPALVQAGGKVRARLAFTIRLDEKQGRWGLWNGVVNQIGRAHV